MKTLTSLKRIFLTGAIALTLGLSLVPRSEAVVPANGSVQAERALPDMAGKGNDGQETHG